MKIYQGGSTGNYAFVNLFQPEHAEQLIKESELKPMVIHGQVVNVRWGKAPPLRSEVLQAYQNGASRSLYLGGIDDEVSEEALTDLCSEIAELENVNILRDKKCAFLNFISVGDALNAKRSLTDQPLLSDVQIKYARDRCAPPRPPALVRSSCSTDSIPWDHSPIDTQDEIWSESGSRKRSVSFTPIGHPVSAGQLDSNSGLSRGSPYSSIPDNSSEPTSSFYSWDASEAIQRAFRESTTISSPPSPDPVAANLASLRNSIETAFLHAPRSSEASSFTHYLDRTAARAAVDPTAFY